MAKSFKDLPVADAFAVASRIAEAACRMGGMIEQAGPLHPDTIKRALSPQILTVGQIDDTLNILSKVGLIALNEKGEYVWTGGELACDCPDCRNRKAREGQEGSFSA